MGKIIDLTDNSEHEILTTTGSSGLLGGTYLGEQPLQSYLKPGEEPKYVLRNKKSGLTIERDQETESIEADTDYQTLALVTDVRILVVAGRTGGDRSRSLALADVFESRVESGLRRSTLTLETLSGELWVFPCQGDPSAVATYIDDAAQLWANAIRLIEESESALDDAAKEPAVGDNRKLRRQLDDIEQQLQTARSRVHGLGGAARGYVDTRTSTLHEQLTAIRRQAVASEAALAHASAQTQWQSREYKAAAGSYEAAIEGYETALEIDGCDPDDRSLRARIRGAVGERELLRAGPLIDADSKRRRAKALADPEEAAKEWETAHEGYRELLGLEWPSTEREFVSDRDLIREQTAEIADDAIGDHMEAGRRWLTSGDKLAVQDRDHQARQVYERARGQFERARQLAKEVRPDRRDETETGFDAATSRLDGAVPTDTVPADPLTTEPNEPSHSDQDREEGEVSHTAGDSSAGATAAGTPPSDDIDGIEELSFHETGTESAEPPASSPSTDTGPHRRRSASTPRRKQRSERSLLDSIQAQKQAAIDGPEDQDSDDGDDSPSSETKQAGAAPETIHEAILQLDSGQFVTLVATVWEARGWMTTDVTALTRTVYDIVAIHEDSDDRLLIWADHGSGEVSSETINKCEATIDGSADADGGVFVTTRPLTPAATSLLEETDITFVDTTTLVAMIREAGLAERLMELASGKPDESPQA